MDTLREEQLVGLAYLEAGAALLRRVRGAHPTKGLFEAADLNWWWSIARSTDSVGQLFWFDDQGRPEAAVIATDWRDAVGLDPAVMPDARPELIAHVLDRGLEHARDLGFGAVDVMVDRNDQVMRELLLNHGFEGESGEALTPDVEAWIDASARPAVSPLADGYQLRSREDTAGAAHHMADERRPDVEARLQQGSLYRADLDLVVLDSEGAPAGWGMFWFDQETGTGLVEPMRTLDAHQKRGLARHILTAGLDRLARAGAERIKIVYEPTNETAKRLYNDVGFVPVKETEILSRTLTAPPTVS